MTKILFLSSLLALLFSGCTDNINESRALGKNGITEISPGLYLKAIQVSHGGNSTNIDTVYVYADSQGNVLPNEHPVSTSQQAGKSIHTATIISNTTPSPSSTNTKFHFDCETLDECKNKILIVENATK